MIFDVNQLDYSLLTPIFILLGTIFVDWTLDLLLPRAQKRLIGWVSILGSIAGIVAALPLWGVRSSFAGALRIDEFSVFFEILFLLTAIGITLISMEYAQRFLPQPGEFYGLILTGTLGMILMAASNELLTAYISLELLSFSSYVLVSYAKTNLKSNEAGMKYIILGAFSSALLLYGISLLYGVLGTSYIPDIAAAVGRMSDLSPAFGVALVLILAGLGFKIAAVPFHMWTPDVYEGAPTPVTAYLSVASKAAGFALVLRLMVGGFFPIQDRYQVIFAVLAVLTMTLGNLVAIQQRNVKRLLAYSSIGQAGYVLVGLASLVRDTGVAEQASRGIMLHLAGYVFTNLAAFGAVVAFQNANAGREMIADMAGFARRAPFVGLAMMVALFSLAGMPLFAGFVTKFYLFAAAARAGLLWLVAIAVINSVISLYYYLLVVYQMYVRVPPGYELAAHNGHGGHVSLGQLGSHGDAHSIATPAESLAVPAGIAFAGMAQTGHGASESVATHDGHGPASTSGSIGDGHSAAGDADLHGTQGSAGGHGAHGGGSGDGDGGPIIPWWRRSITAEMPKEASFPAYRIPWATSLGLLLFLAGIFIVGLWPAPLIDLLRDASSALFAG